MTITRTATHTVTDFLYDICDEETSTIHKANIIFRDGKFHRCIFPFHNYYTREQWAVLADLENEIYRIEQNLSK